MRVYVLQHTHVLADDDEDVKMIGCYSSAARAAAAADRLRQRPGFAESPDGFTVDEYLLDEDQWTDGFVTAE